MEIVGVGINLKTYFNLKKILKKIISVKKEFRKRSHDSI